MTFLVSINEFEGPLDLMLHLIREKQLSLFDLDLDVLTDQYIAYINAMEEMSLEIASEYLAELAGLLEYKSKSLIPNAKTTSEEIEEDPKEKLVRRLIEYQRFKDIASQLNDRFNQRNKQLSKSVSSAVEKWLIDDDTLSLKGNPYDLMKAMNRCLKHIALKQPLLTKTTTSELTIEQIVELIKTRFEDVNGSFKLTEMIETANNLSEAILMFLAVLELIKMNEMIYHIDKKEVIWLKWSKIYA